jgi:hypothetical protein
MTVENELAAQIVGIRQDAQPFDPPAELGFHCPACQYPLFNGDEYDDRLTWSRYNGFLRCSVCNKDYPTTLCMPKLDRANKIYLLCVKAAIERSQRMGREEPQTGGQEPGLYDEQEFGSRIGPSPPAIRNDDDQQRRRGSHDDADSRGPVHRWSLLAGIMGFWKDISTGRR